MYKLTIGIAVYNVEKYLRECLDSIIPQLVSNSELLLVDDGSTDSSGRICEEYVQGRENIRVIHQKNAGVSAARNAMIDGAQGEWITFVDGDDMLTEDAVSTMCECAERETADLVIFDFNKLLNNKIITSKETRWTERRIKDEDGLSDFRYSIFTIVQESGSEFKGINNISPWGKLFRKSFLEENSLRFPVGIKRGEDCIFSINNARFLKEVYLCPKQVYIYRINDSSVTLRFSADIIKITDDLLSACYRIIYKEYDQRAVELMNIGCVNLIGTALNAGAYHIDCPWKQKKRIAWLKELQMQFWVHQVLSVPPQKEKEKMRKAIVRLANAKTYFDYLALDVLFYVYLRIVPRYIKNKKNRKV